MMNFKTLFFSCFILLQEVAGFINYVSNGNTYKKQLIQVGAKIANENYDFRIITFIMSKDIEDIYINMFLSTYKGTVIIETKKDDSDIPKQVVLIIDSYYSFLKLIPYLKADLNGRSLLHGRVRILIIINNARKTDRITKILWTYFVTEVVIVADIKNNKTLFTYNPYKNYLDCQNTELKQIGIWNSHVMKPSLVFEDKMSDMKGCPMYISTDKLYHPSTELKVPLQVIKKIIVRLLSEVMNFTPIVSTRDYISIDSDRAKNWSDALNDVISGKANISTCSIPLGVDRLGLLDYSFPYFRIKIVWIAPPLASAPTWWRLFSPLNGYLWLAILIVLLLVTSLPFIIKFKKVKNFCNKYFKNFNKVRPISIRICGVTLGQPIKIAPKKFRDFYIISLWVWFTFVVRNAYQSVLIGALKTDVILGNFANLKEAVEYGYNFGGRAGTVLHFDQDPIVRNPYEIVPDSLFESTFESVVAGKKPFVIATSLDYAWVYCLSHGNNENECGHVLPESILLLPLVVWMRNHSPFTNSVSIWVNRFIESGFLQREVQQKPLVNKSVSNLIPLTWKQTISCYICLSVGYSLSILTFFLEIFRYRANQKKVKLLNENKP